MKAMTGADLIKWIHDNQAEQLQVLIEHRDEGGSYRSAEHLGEQQEPALCNYGDELYGTIRKFEFNVDDPTAIIL